MQSIIYSIKAEVNKQFKLLLRSRSAVILMSIFPFLEFIVLYYSYLPFKDIVLEDDLIKKIGSNDYFLFLLIGYMGLIFFHSVTFSSRILTVERVLGTLELAYMSQSNKFGLLIGNSIVGIFKNAWISIILFFIIINLTSFNYKIDFIDILIMIPLFIISIKSIL